MIIRFIKTFPPFIDSELKCVWLFEVKIVYLKLIVLIYLSGLVG